MGLRAGGTLLVEESEGEGGLAHWQLKKSRCGELRPSAVSYCCCVQVMTHDSKNKPRGFASSYLCFKPGI